MAVAICATASASASTSIRMTPVFKINSPGWVVPAAGRCDLLVHGARSPRLRLVCVDRGARLQHRVHDPPGFLDVVLAREQRRVPVNGVDQHPRIRVLLVGVRAGVPASSFTAPSIFSSSTITSIPMANCTVGLTRMRRWLGSVARSE